jgi:hypothetical protein
MLAGFVGLSDEFSPVSLQFVNSERDDLEMKCFWTNLFDNWKCMWTGHWFIEALNRPGKRRPDRGRLRKIGIPSGFSESRFS